MASDWIKSKADEEARRKEEARLLEEAKHREHELIKALGAKFVESLRIVLNDDIVAWNRIANPVRHEPRALVGHAKHPVKLVSTHALFGRAKQVNRH